MPYFAVLEFDRPVNGARCMAKLIAPDDVSEAEAIRSFEAWESRMADEIPHHVFVRIVTYGLQHIPPGQRVAMGRGRDAND